MIIRSQDKTTITNFQNVTDIVASYEEEKVIEIIAYLAGGGKTHLATYSTDEKAIKVLDMITETYCRIEDIKCGAVQAQKYDSFCFNMPQDSEV